MVSKNLFRSIVVLGMFLFLLFAVVPERTVTYAQQQNGPIVVLENVNLDSPITSFNFDRVVSHSFLRSDGSAVRLRESIIHNNGSSPLEDITWCYFWGQISYTSIFSKDDDGFLVVDYYMYQSSTYGWGMCVQTHFRNPVPGGGTYEYTEGITIANHHSVVNDVIYAGWWTDPGFAVEYVEDVHWAFNNESVIADPVPDQTSPTHALWYRTSQDGPFTINIQVFLSSTMGVEPLSQGIYPFNGNDPMWEDDPYGVGTGNVIGGYGCYLVSATMAMNYFADLLGLPTDITPGDLNTWLSQPKENGEPIGYGKCGEGYPGYCYVISAVFGLASKELFNAPEEFVGYSINETIPSNGNFDAFEDNLQDGELGILNVYNGGSDHYVLVTGITVVNGVTTLSINDPWQDRGSTTLLAQYGNNHQGNVRWLFIKDLASHDNLVTVKAYSPLQLVITDQYGNRTGFDPIVNVNYQEIPGSAYTYEYSPGYPIGSEPIKVFEVATLEPNSFTVQTIGTGSGPFTLVFSATTDSGENDEFQINGYIVKDEVQTYTVQYDPDTGFVYKVLLPLIMK